MPHVKSEEGAFKTLESGRMELSGHFPITSWSSVLYEGPRGDGKTAEKRMVDLELGASASLAPADFSSTAVTAFAGRHNEFLWACAQGLAKGPCPWRTQGVLPS